MRYFQISTDNFNGFIRADDKVYGHHDELCRKVNTHFFKGIVFDPKDDKRTSQLVLGGLTTGEHCGKRMWMFRLANDKKTEPELCEVLFSAVTPLSDADVHDMHVKQILKMGFTEMRDLTKEEQTVLDHYKTTKINFKNTANADKLKSQKIATDVKTMKKPKQEKTELIWDDSGVYFV